MEIEGYSNYTIDKEGVVINTKTKRIMKHINNKGYLRVILSNNGKAKTFGIHRLLALQFIPNPNIYPEVDHIDKNKANNNLNNLRWATKSMQQNNRNAYGKIKHIHISYCYHSKNKYYQIKKTGCFLKVLNVEKYTLDDAIELRTKLLEEHDLPPIAEDE